MEPILHIISNRWFSAISGYCLSLAQALQGEAQIFVCLKKSPIAEKLKNLGFVVIEWENFSLFNYFALYKIIAQMRIKKIICYQGKETFLCSLLCKKVFIFRFKGDDLKCNGFLRRLIQKAGNFRVFRLFTPTKMAALIYSEAMHVKVSVLPLGINPEKFFYIENKEILKPAKIILLGRLDPIKGHREFMEIYAKGKKNLPESCLHIVGLSANLKVDELRLLARNLGLREGEDILFSHTIFENIADLINESTLGVIPSLGSEWICRVGAEFLLCGLPILVSGAGTTAELLACENAGYSFYGLNEEAKIALLKKALEQSIAEPKSVRKIRANAASNLYSLNKMREGANVLLEG